LSATTIRCHVEKPQRFVTHIMTSGAKRLPFSHAVDDLDGIFPPLPVSILKPSLSAPHRNLPFY
jgi:hypothetical protein